MPKQSQLQQLEVRPAEPHEVQRWDKMVNEHHYLGFKKLVGESLKYVAHIHGEWVALLGWATASFKCGRRDEWIGWTKEQQWRRLVYIANNSRFLILPGVEIANLASKVLSMTLRRLSADWQSVYGHPVVIAETFVDQSRFLGTCYRAANWRQLGQTRGFGRNGGKYYHHGESKTVYVYPLRRSAKQLLTSCFLSPELTARISKPLSLNLL